jgi:CRISPR-associated endonuclease/helicase Cas3
MYPFEFTYQDGDISFKKKKYVKDPYFRGEYVLTTIDSFIHNLLRAPVIEIDKLINKRSRAIHYHVPFAYIYPSCVFIDEAHVAAQDETGKIFASLSVALDVLSQAEIPIVVMSATLGEWKYEIFKDFIFLSLAEHDEEKNDEIHIHDPEFENIFSKTQYRVTCIDEEDIEKVSLKKVQEGKRVLIIINDIRKVIDLSKSLKGLPIHSMLTREDREKAEQTLTHSKIVVGTSAIEAGIDVSFDALITYPDSVESLVQRVGRVCRYGSECIGEIYLLGEDCEKFAEIKNWRLPYKLDSYTRFLQKEFNIDYKLKYLLERVMEYVHIPYEEIKEIFKEAGLSFVRGALVEVCTDNNCDYDKSFSTSLDKVSKSDLLKVSKVKIGNNEERAPQDVNINWLIKMVEEYGDMPRFVINNYVKNYGPQ